jgi:4a-hydroxytetrahydrobiopterin dehydratase
MANHMKLENLTCEPCTKNAQPVSPDQLSEALQSLPQWEIKVFDNEPHLIRRFLFDNYATGLRFTIKVGEMADTHDHHPLIITAWGKVTIHWWTHTINNIHMNDLILAAKTESIYQELSGS